MANEYEKVIRCKFCRKDVRYNKIDGRVYELDSNSFHAANCERRSAWYKQRSAETQQQRREAH